MRNNYKNHTKTFFWKIARRRRNFLGISDSSGENPRFLPPGEFLFPPHISGPWGGNFYFPPTFRDPGGEVKKALPPHNFMGGGGPGYLTIMEKQKKSRDSTDFAEYAFLGTNSFSQLQIFKKLELCQDWQTKWKRDNFVERFLHLD